MLGPHLLERELDPQAGMGIGQTKRTPVRPHNGLDQAQASGVARLGSSCTKRVNTRSRWLIGMPRPVLAMLRRTQPASTSVATVTVPLGGGRILDRIIDQVHDRVAGQHPCPADDGGRKPRLDADQRRFQIVRHSVARCVQGTTS